ncbi:MAG: T9SS type A sorting domain-containing protein, partial [Bacteroidota bacterium]
GNTYWYFSPNQFGAMLRADLDGNGGILEAGGNDLGITKFSSGVTPVMGGLAGLHGQYLLDMGGAPGYIPNFHHYSTNVTKAESNQGLFMDGEYTLYSKIIVANNGFGVSPEADSLSGKLRWLRAGINRNFWLTEFGYDSFAGSGSGNQSGVEAMPFSGGDGAYDSQKVQAQWLTRGVLEAASSKKVDRMMLYELADHPDNGNSYSFSGLLTQGGKFKRSWFYIMTLKHILGEYTYNKAIKNQEDFVVETKDGNGNWVGSTWNKVRVYEFTKGSEKIFAIWSPTETAIAPFRVRIQFPNNNEYSVGGSAVLYQIVELSEKGRRWNWSPHVSGQTVTIESEVLASETPVFLQINKTFSKFYNPPAHVTNLSCTPQACCGAIELTWTPPANTINTLVFYKEKDAGGNCPTSFDFVSWTLFANSLGGGRSNVTVTGLEQGKEYCFTVIPISLFGSLPPADLSIAPILSCTTDAGTCSNCLLDIAENQLEIGASSDLTIDKLKTILSVDNSPNTCDDINPEGCAYIGCNCGGAIPPFCDDWCEWKNPAVFPEANTFYINFDKPDNPNDAPKRIKAIYVQDWTGNGDIKIQYESCTCPGRWFELATIKLEGLGTCNQEEDGNGQPLPIFKYFIKEISRNTVVRRLRITKMHSSASIRRMYICGTEDVCPVIVRQPENPSEFRADEIRTNSALLRWNAARYDTLDAQSNYEEKYLLRVSQQLDGNGNLVNPAIYDIDTDPLEYEASHRLDDLAPATTYHVGISVPNPCPPTPAPDPNTNETRITFTTEAELGERSSTPAEKLNTKTDTPYSVTLRPNPASEDVLVSISAGELETILLMNASGRVIKKQSASGNSTSLRLDGVQPGMYWVRTIRKDKTPLTVLLIKN